MKNCLNNINFKKLFLKIEKDKLNNKIDKKNIKYGFSSIVHIYKFKNSKYAIKTINKNYYYKHLISKYSVLNNPNAVLINNTNIINKDKNKYIFCTNKKSKLTLRIPYADINIINQSINKEIQILNKIKNIKLSFVPNFYGHCFLNKHNLIIEYIDGKTLNNFINNKIINLSEIQNIFKTVYNYILELHKYNITINDIGSSNIIINKKKIYLIDFGDAIITKKKDILKGDFLNFCYLPLELLIILMLQNINFKKFMKLKSIKKYKIYNENNLYTYYNLATGILKKVIKTIFLFKLNKKIFYSKNKNILYELFEECKYSKTSKKINYLIKLNLKFQEIFLKNKHNYEQLKKNINIILLN